MFRNIVFISIVSLLVAGCSSMFPQPLTTGSAPVPPSVFKKQMRKLDLNELNGKYKNTNDTNCIIEIPCIRLEDHSELSCMRYMMEIGGDEKWEGPYLAVKMFAMKTILDQTQFGIEMRMCARDRQGGEHCRHRVYKYEQGLADHLQKRGW